MSGSSVTEQPDHRTPIHLGFSRDTPSGSPPFTFRKGGSSTVPVLRCLETKRMQRMAVQSSGNPFPSTFQGVCSQDMYPFTICGEGPHLEEEGILSLSPQHVEKRGDRNCPRRIFSWFLQSSVPRSKDVRRMEACYRPLTPQHILGNSPFQDGNCIDLIDAYCHSTIHQGYRKFLRFQTWDTFYLPFDLSPASWVFTKVMVEINVMVHGMGFNLCQYLDGWLIYSIKASGTQAKFSLSVTRWHI